MEKTNDARCHVIYGFRNSLDALTPACLYACLVQPTYGFHAEQETEHIDPPDQQFIDNNNDGHGHCGDSEKQAPDAHFPLNHIGADQEVNLI